MVGWAESGGVGVGGDWLVVVVGCGLNSAPTYIHSAHCPDTLERFFRDSRVENLQDFRSNFFSSRIFAERLSDLITNVIR